MGQQVTVDRWLRFRGAAANDANVKGDMSTERMCSVDWFDQKTLDETNKYTATKDGSSDAIALHATGYCGVKVTTGSTDDDCCFLGTALIFDISQSPAIETKIYITDVSSTHIFFGFSDANTESTQAHTLHGTLGTLGGAATDCAGFLIDADYLSSSIVCASTTDSTTYQSVDTAIDWADTKSYVLKVALDTDGNARFYVNGDEKGYIASAVSDVPLCAVWNFGTRDGGGAQTIYARYLKRWQDIP